MNKNLVLIAVVLFSFLFNNCSQRWQKVITKGKVQKSEFKQTINIEIVKGIIIMPVTIKGKTYRFLYDTGAPTSISKEIQKEFLFKTISTGKVIDSDNHRKKVSYVEVDSLFLGDVPFMDQTAFVGDFNANPILACMDVDGIVGSNLIRFCNWTIDYQNKTVSFTNQDIAKDHSALPSHTFETDLQYNIIVDLNAGDATITSLKIDYGSNGSLSIPPSTFSALKQKNNITNSFTKSGYTQTGITGIVKEEVSEIAYLDTVKIGEMSFYPVEFNSNGNGLIGSGILSRSVISIDWSNKRLYFSANDLGTGDFGSYGLTIGQKKDGSLYIQAIIEGSSAAEAGLVPNMKIIKIDSLDFTSSSSYCDFIYYNNTNNSLSIDILDDQGVISHCILIKRELR